MDSCEKYIELISAGIDGELSDEELSQLMDHLKVCPECREYARLVKAAGDAMRDMTEEAPAGLTEGVMKEIRPAKKKRWSAGRIGTVAAALAVVMLATAAVPNMRLGCGVSAPQNMMTTNESAPAAADRAPKNESAVAEENTGVMEPETAPAQTNGAGMEDTSAAGEGDKIDGAAQVMPAIPFGEDFTAVAVWYGGDPEKLAEYEQEAGAESEVYVFVPSDDIDGLAQEHNLMLYTQGDNISPDGEKALIVIY